MAENAGKSERENDVQRWSRWKTFALERLPGPYWLTVVLATLIAAAEQALEYSLDDPTFRHLTSGDVANLLVVPAFPLIFHRALHGDDLVVGEDQVRHSLTNTNPRVHVSSRGIHNAITTDHNTVNLIITSAFHTHTT